MQLEKIASKLQPDVIASFWSMLQELESKADGALDRHFVEGYYRQWNTITGDNKAPRWTKKVDNKPKS